MHPSKKAGIFHELSRLVRSGIPFPKAIEKLASHSSGDIWESLKKISTALAAGKPVGEAVRAGTPLIGTLEACVFAACDRAGRLETGLEEASEYHAAIATARSRMKSRLAYPVFVIHFALLLLSLPVLFAEDGGTGAYFKTILFAAGGLWLSIILFAAAIRAIVAAAGHNAAADRLLRAVPPFGGLRCNFSLARFCSAYHMQLAAGVNVLGILETSAAASGSAVLRDAIESAIPAVRSGGQVGEALKGGNVFPAEFMRAFATGEETGELDRELQRIGNDCRDAAMRRLETITEWVPRLIYVAILVFIGWRIFASYMGRMHDIQNIMNQ